jgi:2,4-dienoyl-CoA reductase-like NADH-dependent reductase (Old Yellow Enzyme family)
LLKIQRRIAMKTIFEQTEINSLVLKNRLVRSATWEGMWRTVDCKTAEFFGPRGQEAPA